MLQMTPSDKASTAKSEFTLVFPKWEFYTIIFAVFLCTISVNVVTYVYLEGKSNYFKGALLLLSYFVLIAAFFFEPSAIY
jgi:Ca2+:H+ antiporter